MEMIETPKNWSEDNCKGNQKGINLILKLICFRKFFELTHGSFQRPNYVNQLEVFRLELIIF